MILYRLLKYLDKAIFFPVLDVANSDRAVQAIVINGLSQSSIQVCCKNEFFKM